MQKSLDLYDGHNVTPASTLLYLTFCAVVLAAIPYNLSVSVNGNLSLSNNYA